MSPEHRTSDPRALARGAGSRRKRSRTAVVATAAVALGATLFTSPSASAGPDPAQAGQFSAPFVEPDIYGVDTAEKCIDRSLVDADDDSGTVICKPSAASIALLPDGDLLYWSGLEATENVNINAVAQFGLAAENDQTRRLSLGSNGPEWSLPSPVDGGAQPQEPLPLVEIAPFLLDQGDGEVANLLGNQNPNNADGALFGSDQVFLSDGRLLVASGTDYYSEFGAVELEGLRATRIFDPETNSFTNVGDLNNGRWYPTLVTQPNGKVLAFSGVQKLIKPVYLGEDIAKSGRNEVTVEEFDPATGEWTLLPASANRTLPLYPRMHLLPNGQTFFNTNGQTFNPFGQAYDSALWNIATVFDPNTNTWNDLGIPGATNVVDELQNNAETAPASVEKAIVGLENLISDPTNAIDGGIAGVTDPLVGEGDFLDVGYRGSTFSVMLPIRPDESGEYSKVELLSAGGTLAPTPGSYFPVSFSRLTELDVDGNQTTMSTRQTSPLNRARWYGHGTVLPTGEVLVTSGGDRDHVLAPGLEAPITTPELYDPETETWTPVADQIQERTYHNSAVLLPDARVLVGGHNPIPTGYNSHVTLPGGFAPNDGRDPSFEIYSPPYLFRGDQPQITEVADTFGVGSTQTIELDIPAADVDDVVIVRNTAETHIVDGDQRAVEVPVVERNGNTITVAVPDANVLPGGPYMLFVNKATDEGPIPSKAAMISVQGTQAEAFPGGASEPLVPGVEEIPGLDGIPELDALPGLEALATPGGTPDDSPDEGTDLGGLGDLGEVLPLSSGTTSSVSLDSLAVTGATPTTPIGSDRSLPLLPVSVAAVMVAAVAVAGSRIRRHMI